MNSGAPKSPFEPNNVLSIGPQKMVTVRLDGTTPLEQLSNVCQQLNLIPSYIYQLYENGTIYHSFLHLLPDVRQSYIHRHTFVGANIFTDAAFIETTDTAEIENYIATRMLYKLGFYEKKKEGFFAELVRGIQPGGEIHEGVKTIVEPLIEVTASLSTKIAEANIDRRESTSNSSQSPSLSSVDEELMKKVTTYMKRGLNGETISSLGERDEFVSCVGKILSSVTSEETAGLYLDAMKMGLKTT